MERLVNICLVLALFFVRFSLQYAFNVTVKPNTGNISYSDFVKEPMKNITCESNCPNCTHSWEFYAVEGHVNTVLGKNLLLNNTVVRRKYGYFFCRVLTSNVNYTDSRKIYVIIQQPTTLTPHSVSVVQSSLNTVYSNSTSVGQHVENDETVENAETFPRDHQFVFIGISAAAGLLLIIVVVIFGILCAKTMKNTTKTRKESRGNVTAKENDHVLEMTENTLYVTTNVAEVPPSYPAQNDTATTESGNDIYAVVNKTKKSENHKPVYVEVRNSQPEREDKTARTRTKSDEKEGNKPGHTSHKDGMVYVEIDFNDRPSTGKSLTHGAEDKILYVEIDSVKQAVPKNEEEGNHDSQQNGKE